MKPLLYADGSKHPWAQSQIVGFALVEIHDSLCAELLAVLLRSSIENFSLNWALCSVLIEKLLSVSLDCAKKEILNVGGLS